MSKGKSWKRVLRWSIGIVVGLVLFLLVGLKLMYGGGSFYPDLGTKPLVPTNKVQVLTTLDFPPGMVVTSSKGRVFYTLHPFGKPERFTKAVLFELVKGKHVPYPSLRDQSKLFGMMGITVDRQNRLWAINPGATERRPTRLIAIDLNTNKIVLDHAFANGVAGLAQDLRVTRDGKTVFLADTGLMRFSSGSLIVFDVASRKSRTLLKGHSSMMAQNYKMRTKDGYHSIGYGLVTFAVGLDGIALSHDDKWLYFATMSHDSLYRIPVRALLNEKLSPKKLAATIEFLSKKPLSDGIEVDKRGNVYLTDVEHGRGLSVVTADRKLKTVVRDKRVIWADCVHIAADGSLYYTDSAIPAYLTEFLTPPSLKVLKAHRPYRIFRLEAPKLP